MLATNRHRDSGLNVLDEPRKRWNKANEEGGDSTPVGAVLGVSVDALEVVQVGYTDTTAANDVIAKPHVR